MIDLHSHILPALDDGSPDDATSLEMARMAVDDGIQTIVATPHYLNGVGVSSPDVIPPAVARLQSLLDSASIPLRLRHAMEMPLLDNLVDLYRSGLWPAYDPARRYVLFEMPDLPFRALDILARSVSTLHLLGTTPVLAHPERLECLDDIEAARRVHRLGARFQITASALLADDIPEGRRARAWLDEGLVACIATDAHSIRHRPPLLSPARRWIVSHYGEPAADALTAANPAAILQGDPLP
jgi:protein-tyrosine phosphatase